jgi:large subunit ribosomal protein L1
MFAAASCQRLASRICIQQHSYFYRSYVTRAHATPRPTFPIIEALQNIRDDIQKRRKKKGIYFRKMKKLLTNNPETTRKPPARRNNPDETIELALNLNLDPKKPGQSIRGSLSLPHGTGRKGIQCLVFSNDEDLAEKALAMGATHAGGESLVDKVVDGEIPLDNVQAAFATTDMSSILTKRAARILGPRKLMPNVKVGTLLDKKEALLLALETTLAGKDIEFRTEKEGILHVPVGKSSFTLKQLLENIGTVITAVFEKKPESYGKGKKKTGKQSKSKATRQPIFLLRATVSSTQSKGFRVELKTLDPASPFFLSSLNPLDNIKEIADTPLIPPLPSFAGEKVMQATA